MAIPWTVPRLWPGQTGVVIGAGPSLTEEDLEAVRWAGVPCIAVGLTFRRAPWADMMHAADMPFWRQYPDAHDFAGMKTGLHESTEGAVLCPVKGPAAPWSLDPAVVAHGCNSGYSATGIMLLTGLSRVVLLAMDCCDGPDGAKHWHAPHKRNPTERSYADWLAAWRASPAPPGVEIVNATRGGALDCYPRMDLCDAIR